MILRDELRLKVSEWQGAIMESLLRCFSCNYLVIPIAALDASNPQLAEG